MLVAVSVFHQHKMDKTGVVYPGFLGICRETSGWYIDPCMLLTGRTTARFPPSCSLRAGGCSVVLLNHMISAEVQNLREVFEGSAVQ